MIAEGGKDDDTGNKMKRCREDESQYKRDRRIKAKSSKLS